MVVEYFYSHLTDTMLLALSTAAEQESRLALQSQVDELEAALEAAQHAAAPSDTADADAETVAELRARLAAIEEESDALLGELRTEHVAELERHAREASSLRESLRASEERAAQLIEQVHHLAVRRVSMI